MRTTCLADLYKFFILKITKREDYDKVNNSLEEDVDCLTKILNLKNATLPQAFLVLKQNLNFFC